jgi:hypothetical protein
LSQDLVLLWTVYALGATEDARLSARELGDADKACSLSRQAYDRPCGVECRRQSYSGTFTLDAYDTSFSLTTHIVGVIKGTRVTTSTTVAVCGQGGRRELETRPSSVWIGAQGAGE